MWYFKYGEFGVQDDKMDAWKLEKKIMGGLMMREVSLEMLT